MILVVRYARSLLDVLAFIAMKNYKFLLYYGSQSLAMPYHPMIISYIVEINDIFYLFYVVIAIKVPLGWFGGNNDAVYISK